MRIQTELWPPSFPSISLLLLRTGLTAGSHPTFGIFKSRRDIVYSQRILNSNRPQTDHLYKVRATRQDLQCSSDLAPMDLCHLTRLEHHQCVVDWAWAAFPLTRSYGIPETTYRREGCLRIECPFHSAAKSANSLLIIGP